MTDWIPVKWHEITDQEREKEGYPKECEFKLDCPLPEDGEEILVAVKNPWSRKRYIVESDICMIYDEQYCLDGNGDWRDVAAWMPMPEYEPKGESDE